VLISHKEPLIKATLVIPAEAWVQQNQYLIDSFLCENNLVQRFLKGCREQSLSKDEKAQGKGISVTCFGGECSFAFY